MRLVLLVAFLSALAVGRAGAQEAAEDAPLRVGVLARPPFAIPTADGAWLGLGIDLWRIAAEDLGLSYEYVPVEPDQAGAALAGGKLDLLLPVDATPALEARADATHPIYTSTLGVASNRPSRILSVIEGLFTWQFFRIVLSLSAVLLLVGALVWGVERHRNREQFHPSPLKGLGDGFWWAGVTLTTIGYGDKAPVTLLGRAVAMFWMLMGLAISASLTAAVVTLANTGRDIEVPEVFTGRVMGVVEGTTAAALLRGEGARNRIYPSLAEALQGLDAGEVEGVAAAAPALEYAVAENGAYDFTIRRTRLDPQYVSFALPDGSVLREPLNVALLQRLVSETGLNLIDRYLPEDNTR